MATYIKSEQLPRVAADELREFSYDLQSAYQMAPQDNWADLVATIKETDAPRLTFPIPLSAAGYKKKKGQPVEWRSLWARQADLYPEIWQDAVKVKAALVEAYDFLGFNDQASAMGLSAAAAPNEWVASVIEANPLLDVYRDQESNTASTINLFHASHLVNVLKPSGATFNNSALAGVGGFTIANVGAWMTYFRKIPSANGKSLGLTLTHVLVPPARAEEALNFFSSDYIIRAVGANAAGQEQNLYKNRVEVIVGNELTNDNVVYPLALNKKALGLVPFGVIKSAGPTIEIFDKSSAMYENEESVGLRTFLKGSAGALLPHPIAKVTIS